jgi:hypothetical protein
MELRQMKIAIAVLVSALSFAATGAASVNAQDTTSNKQIGPAVQKVSTAQAISTEALGAITNVRELADGRLLVNDGARRRLLIMDTSLHTVQVVLDSLTDVANAYGTRAGALLPYRADSTLFVDPASLSMLVIDPLGAIAKVRSVWRANDVFAVSSPGGSQGWPGVSASNRIVYRIPAQPAPPKVAPPAGVPYFPPQPDSAFIVGVNLDTRKLDTLASIRIPKQDLRIRELAEGGITLDQIVNPLPGADEWAVLPDGRVAIVRGRDYRVEYLNADGTWTSSAKLPYDWQRMTDEDKQKMVDSTRNVLEKQANTQWVANVIRWVNQYNGKYPEKFPIPADFVVPPGFPKDWILPAGIKFPQNYIYACAPGQEPPASLTSFGPQTVTSVQGGPPGSGTRTITSTQGAGDLTIQRPAGVAPGALPAGGSPQSSGAANAAMCLPAPVSANFGSAPPPPKQRAVVVIDPSELPDYRPPFLPGSVRADADNNLWIRTVLTKPVPGGSVYDIISPQGELVNRLQMPPGYTIVGFGKGKVVYASMRDASGVHLARIRLK